MKRIFRFAAVNVLGLALLAPAMQLQAAPGRDHRRWDDRGHAQVYVAPAYPAPEYYANGYAYPDGGYYYPDRHAGGTAAIIGGGAVAGAVIGGAVGHGEGAAIGAVAGGIAGVIASESIHRHDHR